ASGKQSPRPRISTTRTWTCASIRAKPSSATAGATSRARSSSPRRFTKGRWRASSAVSSPSVLLGTCCLALRRQPGQRRRLGDLAGAGGGGLFQHFPPIGNGPGFIAFLLLHRFREPDLVFRVVALASRRIAPAAAFIGRAPLLPPAPPIQGDRDIAFSALRH